MKSPTDAPRFPLDEHVLPGSFPVNKPCYLNHGKHVARNRVGIWFCGFVFDRWFKNRNWLALSVSATPHSLASAFPEPILLVGRNPHLPSVFDYESGFLGNCCLLMDDNDRLHLFYESERGIHLVSADASGNDARKRLASAAAWSAPQKFAEAGSALGDATVLPSGEIALYFTHDEQLRERAGNGPASVVSDSGTHPTVFVDAQAATHLAFERDRRIFYLRRGAAETEWTDSRGKREAEIVAHFCSSWPSIAATEDGKVVIAYQGEGKAALYRDWQLYNELRDGAGSTISYALLDGGQWTLHDLLRSRDIVLHRRPHHRHPQVVPRTIAFLEELWRPSLAMDRHGALWMFYVNTTRRHIYWSRFDGRTFGERHEARGPFDCLERELSVQKDARRQNSIGFMVRAAKQMYFAAIAVPGYASNQKRRVVFLDNLEVARMENVEHRLGVWAKHPEPLFGAGISGAAPDDHPLWCQVYKREDGFEMHYMGSGERLRSNAVPGRAFSRDGLRWEKREPFDHLSMTLDGKPFPNAFWRPVHLEETGERDPKRRFKGLLGVWRHEGPWEKRWYKVVASPDAKHWHTVEGIEPVVVGDILVNIHLIRDDEDRDPTRRYKALLCAGGQSGRCVAMFTSPDLLHWHDTVYLRENPNDPLSAVCPYPTGPAPIDADGGEHPWEEEIHGAEQWRENGLLLYHYDSFYFGANQHVEKALAVSRDGRHYWRVKRGAINFPHGPCGSWDSGRVRTSLPIRVGDELWMYYCGMPASYFDDPDAKGYVPPVWADAWSMNTTPRGLALRPWHVGLARLRVDGWAYLQLAREATAGEFTTIPFDYTGGRLVLNGTRLGEGGLRAELRTADDRAIVPGFERASCRFSSADSVNARVTWTGEKQLAPGRYRLRFAFEGLRAKLYAFGFD
jgi:hypothetical protein